MHDDPARDGRPTPSRRSLLGALAAAGAGGLAGCSYFDSPSPPVESRLDSADWLLAGHDTHQTGHNPAAAGVPDDPTEQWRIDFGLDGATGGDALEPRPVVVGDRVYLGGRRLSAHHRSDGTTDWEHDVNETLFSAVTDGDALYVPGWADFDSASLYAFDRDDGSRRWRVGGDWSYVGPPVVASDAVYAPTQSTLTVVGTDGEVRWRRPVDVNPAVRPAVTEDAVYHLADGRQLGSYRRTPGVTTATVGSWPRPRWTGDEQYAVLAAPAVVDGRAYAGESITPYPAEPRNDARLRCHDTDGTVQWSRVIGARCASPAVADGVVCALTGVHREVVDRGSHVEMRRDGVLRAFDAGTGEPRWSRTYEGFGNALADPVVADGVCYAALHDGVAEESRLVAVGADGTERWRRSPSSRAYHLAVVGGTLLVTLAEGTVVALG